MKSNKELRESLYNMTDSSGGVLQNNLAEALTELEVARRIFEEIEQYEMLWTGDIMYGQAAALIGEYRKEVAKT